MIVYFYFQGIDKAYQELRIIPVLAVLQELGSVLQASRSDRYLSNHSLLTERTWRKELLRSKFHVKLLESFGNLKLFIPGNAISYIHTFSGRSQL